MKKKLFTMIAALAITFGLSNSVHAQTTVRSIAVTVELKDIIGISPTTPAGSSLVEFLYETAAQYNSDQTSTITDQFRITATKAYDVFLKGSGPFVGQTTSSNTLDLNILAVSARPGPSGTLQTAVVPTTSDQLLITNSPAALDQSFDVSYKIAKNPVLLTSVKQKYATTLTLSVAAH